MVNLFLNFQIGSNGGTFREDGRIVRFAWGWINAGLLRLTSRNCHSILYVTLSLVLKDAKSECDVRKFSEYVLHPENNRGKKVLFNNWGYDTPDSQLLQKEFEKQALEKYTKGQYTLGVLDEYGQRITIQIELIDRNTQKEIIANSGWMVCPNGKIRCNTPLVGGKKK